MDVLVAADDRTGAFEAAAALAERGAGPVPASPWPHEGCASEHAVTVVDLGTRHLSPADAAARAAAVPICARNAHKIDSTLRGNWADELVARRQATGHAVLLVPALPAFGRTCVAGEVQEHGRPVHLGGAASDVRRRVISSRPAELLAAAGATDVRVLGEIDAVAAWLDTPDGIAVADAADQETIDAIVGRWADGPAEVLLAGTSAVVGASAVTLGSVGPPSSLPPVEGPILVVCGSVHPVARSQVTRAEQAGIPVATLADEITAKALDAASALILVTEIPVGDVDEPMAVAAAAGLATGVAELRARVDLAALVLIGGDTAAAVLGPTPAVVHGSVADGTPWLTVDGFDCPIVTRSGGFGSEHALVDLIRHTLR